MAYMDNDIKKIFRTFRRHRLYYKLTDFILLFLFFYTLSYYFNVISLFSRYMEYYVIGTISLDRIIVAVLSAIISILVITLLYVRKAPVNPFMMIESRYEWMRERLKTARDNQYEDNVIASELTEQVTSRLKQVNAGSFLKRKHIITRLLLSTVLVATVIGLSATQTHSGISPLDITRIIEQVGSNLSDSTTSQTDSGKNEGGDEDIYGETSVASLSGESVELLIIPGLGTAVTIRHAEQQDSVQFVPSQTYPVDMISSAAADESYQTIQQLSGQDKNLVKDYAILRSKL